MLSEPTLWESIRLKCNCRSFDTIYIGAIYDCANHHGWDVLAHHEWDIPSVTYICHGGDGRQKVSQMVRPNRDLDGTFFNNDPIVSRMGRPNQNLDGMFFNIVPVVSRMGHPNRDINGPSQP